jgi:hypothetical protein
MSILRQAKISQLHMPVLVQNYVLGLDVTIDDPALMKIFQSQKGLNNVEASLPLTHLRVQFEQIEELTSRRIVHDNYIKILCFDESMRLDNECIVQTRSYLILVEYQLRFSPLF